MSERRQSTSAAKGKKTAVSAKQKNEVQKPFRPRIDRSMNVMEVIAMHPNAKGVLEEYGLHCFHCAFNTLDSVEAGARSHGLTDVDIDNLVTDLQDVLDEATDRPEYLTLTEAAARGLKQIAETEGQTSIALRIEGDGQGGYCMEFDEKKRKGDRIFSCTSVADVSLVTSPEMLWKLGGATIDFQDGRFKLMMDQACGCGTGGACPCKESGAST